jgi:hypothetical protein
VAPSSPPCTEGGPQDQCLKSAARGALGAPPSRCCSLLTCLGNIAGVGTVLGNGNSTQIALVQGGTPRPKKNTVAYSLYGQAQHRDSPSPVPVHINLTTPPPSQTHTLHFDFPSVALPRLCQRLAPPYSRPPAPSHASITWALPRPTPCTLLTHTPSDHMHALSASPCPWKNRKLSAKSAMKMRTREMTTAEVVLSPTPLAPPLVV